MDSGRLERLVCTLVRGHFPCQTHVTFVSCEGAVCTLARERVSMMFLYVVYPIGSSMRAYSSCVPVRERYANAIMRRTPCPQTPARLTNKTFTPSCPVLQFCGQVHTRPGPQGEQLQGRCAPEHVHHGHRAREGGLRPGYPVCLHRVSIRWSAPIPPPPPPFPFLFTFPTSPSSLSAPCLPLCFPPFSSGCPSNGPFPPCPFLFPFPSFPRAS